MIATETIRVASFDAQDAQRHAFHVRLAQRNAQRMKPTTDAAAWRAGLERELEDRLAEAEYIESERRAVGHELAALPTDPDAFIGWFEGLKDRGPGQHDALFPWLAERASLAEMRWFLAQEVGGEAGFDDLVALTQVGFGDQPKLEMARNYWDEMGRGTQKGMHGPMLADAARELDIEATPAHTVWESLALSNLMAGFASNRHYAYHSVGALGAIELTAPSRVSFVAAGLDRLGVSMAGRRYFKLHATLDVKHSQDWNREVLRPLVAEDPARAHALAEGALLRLHAGRRCFVRYRQELGVVS